MESQRTCPVCGEKIVGRSDKKFCCDECRAYYHNLRYRERLKSFSEDKDFKELCSNVVILHERNSSFSLKILGFISKILLILAH